ncbi:MAG: queuosine precursor transporter [Flavobacteriia bacterium]|nr:queuosine precursor transporter [Flavobacteriia bacterium]OJX36023.1 MAG: hypothetical protein BGO87_06015 [Flavobacteriia bacterium 40-80]
MLQTRREVVFLILAGIFITSAIVAELISCKIVDIGLYPIIAGIVPWPVVFLLTDVMNEQFGKQAIKRLSWITMGLIGFCFVIIGVATLLPATENSPVDDIQFKNIFGNSLWVMAGSITAFILSQLIDIRLFEFFKNLTGEKMIWLRSTGSTVVSQLVDSYVVLGIGFLIPGKINFQEFLMFGITGYATKLVIAILLTPLIYVVRSIFAKILK